MRGSAGGGHRTRMVFSPLLRRDTGSFQSCCVYQFHHTRCVTRGRSGPGIGGKSAKIKPTYSRLGHGRRVGRAYLISTTFNDGEVASVAVFNYFDIACERIDNAQRQGRMFA